MARINWLNFLLCIVHANITFAPNPKDSNDELFADAESALGSEYAQFVEQSKQHKPVYFSDNQNTLETIKLESILNSPETETSTSSNLWGDSDEKMITNWDELFADVESALGFEYAQFVEQSKQHKPVYFSDNQNTLETIKLESIPNPETETAYPMFICGFLGCMKKMNSVEEYLEHFKMHEKQGY